MNATAARLFERHRDLLERAAQACASREYFSPFPETPDRYPDAAAALERGEAAFRALLGQRFHGGDIARANTAFSLIYVMGGLVGRPLIGAAMDAVGEPGLGWTLAFFYAIATVGALLAMRRRG